MMTRMMMMTTFTAAAARNKYGLRYNKYARINISQKTEFFRVVFAKESL